MNIRAVFLSLFFATCSTNAYGQYVGFGSTTGGADDCATPETFRVTSLANSGQGTFRDAVSQSCRHIVFDVGGTITLTQMLLIQQSNLTIDGSSAPFPGITIYAPGIRFAIEASSSIGAVHDVIIHHLRVEGSGGDIEAADLLELDGQAAPVHNIVLDHITAVAASDGAFDVWGEVHDVTLSYNLVRDSIKAAHFSRSVQDRDNFTIFGNVYARNNERQIRMRYNNRNIDFANNVIYGWGWFEGGAAGLDLPSDPGYSPSLNIENNIYHYVSGLSEPDAAVLLNVVTFPGSIYFANNQMPAGENDAVSNSAQIPIPAYAAVAKYNTSELGDRIVLCAGTIYPTPEETSLLQQINQDIGGTGAPQCEAPTPAVRPNPPANLTVD